MLPCVIGASLTEILEVRDSGLEEDALWALLRSLVNAILTERKLFQTFVVNEKHVVLLPSGKLTFNLEQRDKANIGNSTQCIHSSNIESGTQLKDVALIILWCAEYNLDRRLPLNISNSLQALLTTMCDQYEVCTVDHVEEICNHQLKLKPLNDRAIIADLCASILGEVTETFDDFLNPPSENLCSEVDHASTQLDTSSNFSDSSRSSKGSQVGCFFGKKFIATDPREIDEQALSVFETTQGVRKCKSVCGNRFDSSGKIQHSRKSRSTTNIHVTSRRHSVLALDEKVKTVRIGSEKITNSTTNILVSYVNHAKASIYVHNPAITSFGKILNSALGAFLPIAESKDLSEHFAVALWIDSNYHFIDNSVTLSKVLHDFPSTVTQTYFIRILYFPPDTNLSNCYLLKAMYIQLRADIMDERVTCSHDDSLALAAHALQCELGDYKPEYGCNYFVIEEFVSPHVVLKLGLSYIRSELPALHRQLAGIGEEHARLLFLRRSRHLEEYGMNFHKAYRLKSCKEENATWIGVGPCGITVFDIKTNFVRIKRHVFEWCKLNKISFKNRKIVLTRMAPDVKLKFYEKEQSRAKYVVTIIGKLHKFYADHCSISQFSPLALFDDITKLSSSLNACHFTTANTSNSQEVENSCVSVPPAPSTQQHSNFTRRKPVLRRPSVASSTSTVTKQRANSRRKSHSTVKADSEIIGAANPSNVSSASSNPYENIFEEDEEENEHQSEVLSSSTYRSFIRGMSEQDKSFDAPEFNMSSNNAACDGSPDDDVETSTSSPRDENRTVLPVTTATYSGDIHEQARIFYRSSMRSDTLVTPGV